MTKSENVSFNANINLQHGNGGTAIMFAAMFGRKELVKLLLRYNPDIQLVDVEGHEDEVISDAVSIANDFFTFLEENDDFTFVMNSNIQPFTDDTGDRFSGLYCLYRERRMNVFFSDSN